MVQLVANFIALALLDRHLQERLACFIKMKKHTDAGGGFEGSMLADEEEGRFLATRFLDVFEQCVDGITTPRR
jgi:hypothetical protein